jgi:hypothetical protein
MIIKNIGYMWHRKYINWESGSELIGYSETNDKKVNFAYQAGIYVLYDLNLNCIYVGQAGRGENTGLYDRLKAHATEDELFCMWERFSWFGFYSRETLQKSTDSAFLKEYKINTDVNEVMNLTESLIIHVQRPRFNKSIKYKFHEKDDKGIEWFYQKAEFEEQEAEFDRLKKICKSLK